MTSDDKIAIDLEGEAATARLGEDLAAILVPGDLVALKGDLGSGKTTLARALIRSIACDPELDVPSPTFTLVQSYAERLPVRHADLYRLSEPDEIEELGLDEDREQAVTLVEWPEKAGPLLGPPTLEIHLRGQGAARSATITGDEETMARLARSLAARRFLERSGMGGARRTYLIGDASMRAYETVSCPDGVDLILMNAPSQPDGPPIRDGLPYSRIAHLAESVVPFVAIDRLLRKAGFAAPRIEAADLDAGFLLIEHLGDEGIVDSEGRPVAERYLAAAELLAELHGRQWPRRAEAAPGITHAIPTYDRGAMTIETELLTDWYLPHVMGREATREERGHFADAWRAVFTRLRDSETTLVLRDYHSPNIIWRADRRGTDRLGLIDFQDALIGPSAFDVASLAQDARVTISPELEAAIVDCYRKARLAADKNFDSDRFARDYAIMAAQRQTKILGIFVRLSVRDGKPVYLRHFPRLRGYLGRVIGHPDLAPVAEFYRRLGLVEEGGR